MRFKNFESDIKVNGPLVYSIVDGLGYFTNLVKRYYSQVGIDTVMNKNWKST